jgi:DNA invertase Pin-like site-specific DNA recombinase
VKKAYSYIRFSSPEQAKGRSQARQMEDCEKYCQAHGLNLVRDEDYTFFDRGLSGYKGEHLGDNGQLAKFLKLVKNGTIERGSTLVVENLDRLSREHVKYALPRFMDLLNDGIDIVTLADGRRYTADFTEIDLIMSIFVMSRAHEESSTKSQRLRDAMRDKHKKAREHSIPMGAAIPLWLKLSKDKQRFEEIPERVGVVKKVFEMAIAGYGKAATAKALTVEGIPRFKPDRVTKEKAFGWGSSSIDKILNNRAVLGEYQPYSVQASTDGKRQPSGEPIKDYYPAIIDEETFYAAQGAIAARKTEGTTRQSENINLWSGIAKCAECGTAMHLVNKGRPPKGGTYLQCYQARKGLCGGKLVRLDNAEAVFPHMLKRMDALALVQDASGKLAKDLKAVEGRLLEQKDLRADYIALLAKRATDAVNELLYATEEKIKELEHEKEMLQAELETEKIGNWQDFMKRMDSLLLTTEGRLRANALLKRLKVAVYIGRRGVSEEGYFVTEKDHSVFVLAQREGNVGCQMFEDAGAYDKASAAVAIDGLLGRMARRQKFIGA